MDGFRRSDRSILGTRILHGHLPLPIYRPQRWESPCDYRFEAAAFMFVHIVWTNHGCHPTNTNTTYFLAQNLPRCPISFAPQRNGSQVFRPLGLCDDTRPSIVSVFVCFLLCATLTLFCVRLSARKGYTHGVVVFNSVHTVAALAGVPLQDLVRDRHARLLWAAMIREGLQVRAPQLERPMPGILRGPHRRRGWH